eukprot:CAMPEP_0194179270 /NCGR_PEP_ID=MMETSP0154-20130528/12761_1 /TAXON_ID=1049557 /ORGANISM="Thalassiothrix antarctica, Strain L6-D1" /LENGTH=385 /DNA_ID=CAMNT_0038894575 /DNA_START=42 /DNA_END=1199 /DNA_ORIENTATION=-
MMLINDDGSSNNKGYHRLVSVSVFLFLLPSSVVSFFGPFASDNNALDKGFNLLETASKVVPQGRIVQTAKGGLNLVWNRMMAELAPQDKSGAYQRPSYTTSTAVSSLSNERGRYHVYVGNPCPWCHRVRLVLALRSITSDIGMTMLEDNPMKASRGGWVFDDTTPNKRDPLGCNDLRELYDKLSPGYKGRCTAPLLIDLKNQKMVSNESSDIIRMLNSFASSSSSSDNLDLYPSELKDTIDETNEWVYTLLNNGCYRCGFATKQGAYDEASQDVRSGLEKCESILSHQKYITGTVFTESDVFLLPTLLRYDGAYAPLFRAGGVHKRIQADYPNVHEYMKRCWNEFDLQTTIDIQDATSSYYKQLFPLNPGGLLPTPITPNDIGLE